jgi:hypothetical protein
MTTRQRYRCIYCGVLLPGWLAWAKAPESAILLGHLSQQHSDQVGVYLDRMRGSEDLGAIAAEAYELIDMDVHP